MSVSTRASTPHCGILGRHTKLSTTARGIIYCPGLTGTELSWRDAGVIQSAMEQLTQCGFRIVTIDDQIQWGNDTHIGRVGSIYTTAQSSYGFDSSKVNLFAASGGAPAVLNWAKANPTKVQSIALVIPAVDIRDIDTNNRTDAVGLANATYGPHVAYGAALPDTAHNPASNAASFAGIPIKIWYSNTDPVCLPATITGFAATAGATTVNLGNLGHAATGLDADDVRLFFSANG